MGNTNPPEFSEGIIILIPKSNTPTTIRDYRPITLLNTEYKIFGNIICNGLRGVEQTSGIPGRKITNNLTKIRNTIMYFSDQHNEQAQLLTLDFEKAFDNIDHEYLYLVLEHMQITPTIIKVIRQLYSNAQSKIQINGYFTQSIPLQSAVRQGCPLSMILFSVAIEPLIRMMANILYKEPTFPTLFNILAYADGATTNNTNSYHTY